MPALRLKICSRNKSAHVGLHASDLRLSDFLLEVLRSDLRGPIRKPKAQLQPREVQYPMLQVKYLMSDARIQGFCVGRSITSLINDCGACVTSIATACATSSG